MSDDLISRQAAIDKIFEVYEYEFPTASGAFDEFATVIIPNLLINLPSAQHTGRWKVSDLPKGKMKYCSECGFGQYIADERRYGFCPNCGARMDEEDNK